MFAKTRVGGFNAPSGKVELLSSLSKKAGEDPLPYYKENQETPFSTPEIAKDYPLVLTTGHRHVAYYHSSNRQVPWCRELKPYPRLQIHPQTAAQLNIKDKVFYVKPIRWRRNAPVVNCASRPVPLVPPSLFLRKT